jgi:hypothetical protein
MEPEFSLSRTKKSNEQGEKSKNRESQSYALFLLRRPKAAQSPMNDFTIHLLRCSGVNRSVASARARRSPGCAGILQVFRHIVSPQ